MDAEVASRRRKVATAGILAGLLLGALDGTVVGTAMPRMVSDLRGLEIYFLPVAVFMIVQTISMPIWGRLSDLYGRRRFYLLGIAVLILGSALCGLSQSMAQLVVFRGVQALGAGATMSLSYTMIADLYVREERARIQGAISGVWGLASLLGPPLGGFLADHLSWRWAFYVNVPVGILSAVLVQLSWGSEVRKTQGRPDVAGAVLLALASAAFMGAVSSGPRVGWMSPPAVGGFLAAATLAAALVAVERRTKDPFLAYDLYRIRPFWVGAVAGACAMICLFGAVLYVPLFLVGVLGSSSAKAGMVLFPMMVPYIACSAASSFLLGRWGIRATAAAGMACCLGAFLLLGRLDGGASWLHVALATALLGTGLGATVAPLLIAGQNSVPRDRMGAATSLIQFMRSMGGAVAVAAMGGLMTMTLQGHLGPHPHLDINQLVSLRRDLSDEGLRALVEALAAGLRNVFHLGAGVSALGGVVALALPGRKATTSPS